MLGLPRQQSIIAMVPMVVALPSRESAKSMWIFRGIATVNSRHRLFLGASSTKRKWLGISAFCF